MRVLVTGGTGLVGVAVCHALRAAGHAVRVVSRHPAPGAFDAIGWEDLPAAVGDVHAVVNLAGEPIAARRWSAEQKQRIHDSRVQATRTLVDAVTASSARPQILVSASAVGYYGPHGDEPLDETSPPGDDFLAGVCQAWEAEARRAESLGLRVVTLRLGVVLAPDGGALARMVTPFRAFLGGRLGHGHQWLSWIHRDDVTGLIIDILANPSYRGPLNATAPNPVTNREFTVTLAATIARPAWLPVPAFALRLALGEMATMLLDGQRVLPKVAETLGYHWRYRELVRALHASVRRR